MEGTAKLTTSNMAAKVKANLADRLSKEMVTRTDDFTKLLQQKKDLDQTGQQTKTDSAGNKPKDKEVSSSDSKTEKPQTEKEDGSKDALQEEALLQSAQQQALAQLNMAQLQPELTAEPITEPVAEAPVQAVETVAVMADGTNEQPQILAEAVAQTVQPQTQENVPVSGRQEKLQPEDPAAAAKETGASREEQPLSQLTDIVTQSKRAGDQSKAAERGMESSVQTSAGQKPQAMEQEDGKDVQPLYGEDTFRSSMETRESAFAAPKTEQQIPVKTTPETLPQDLGQTLAGRLGNSPKTIVIELEPASLGKLTIRLTYEASRAALSIAASNPKTLELLNQKAGEIAQILEEKTGQETLIFTQPTEQEPQYEDGRSSQGGAQQEGREERQQDRQQEEQQAVSFAQQLRLGLI